MGRNNYFQFKQFRIEQRRSAMKVGIDGILLGAWADVHDCNTILDIGTGTGLIALMLAQRSQAQITAIEIEKNAAKESAENVAASPWNNRVEVQNVSLQKFAAETTSQFDLIVSNPPYFQNSLKAGNESRSLARHTDSLPLADLAKLSAELLSVKGRLAVILPVDAALRFIELARLQKLYPVRFTKVSPYQQKDPHRYLMEFSKHQQDWETNSIAIRKNPEGDYSDEFKFLCKEFYLLF
nr:methyltransferase [uncultured Draconibacterium sp.]